MWHLGTWFSGQHGGAGLMFGLDILNDSVILSHPFFLGKCGGSERAQGPDSRKQEKSQAFEFSSVPAGRVASQNWKKCTTLALLCLL